MVLSFTEEMDLTNLKQRYKMDLMERQHKYTILELDAQLRIEAMKAISSNALKDKSDYDKVKKIVFNFEGNENDN